MSTARRSLIEVSVLVVLVALAAGIWWWKDRARANAVAELEAAHTARVEEVVAAADFWAETLVAGEAESVFRSFVAGIAPAILGGRTDSVDLAVVALLDLPGVEYADVVAGDGAVISSSDRKVVSTGSLGDRAEWVLASAEVRSRASATSGVTEVAGPISGPDGPRAFVVVGYRGESIRSESRPTALSSPPEADPA